MNPFTFQTTPNVLFEPGAVKKIAPIVREMGAQARACSSPTRACAAQA